MTEPEAISILKGCWGMDSPSREDKRRVRQALDVLVETGDPEWLTEAGAWYYEDREFEKAVYYYELAAQKGSVPAMCDLGYAYLYGNGVRSDPEKAFLYYSAAADNGDLTARYKIADMYRDGLGVRKSKRKYRSIINALFRETVGITSLSRPVPQIVLRKAELMLEGDPDADTRSKAIHYLYYARDFLAQRIAVHGWWGDLRVMRRIIDDIYAETYFDHSDWDLYDLIYLLRSPVSATFMYYDDSFTVSSQTIDGAQVIMFGGQAYADALDFLQRAKIEDEKLTTLYPDLVMLSVEYPD